MKRPFPGMDPYLQRHWRDVHARLMVYSVDHIQGQLPEDLIARVEEGVSIDSDEGGRFIYPDVRVVSDDSGTGNGPALLAAPVALAEPIVVEVDEPPPRHVEIVEPASSYRVVTTIEFLSPTNKQTVDGRFDDRRKQADCIAGGVNLVEIDLIRGGDFILAANENNIPVSKRKTYAACVRRVTRRRQASIYPIGLRDALPTIPIPLRPTDRDVYLDLQALIDQCYERGRYSTIDYRGALEPPLPRADAAWARQRIVKWRSSAGRPRRR